MVDVVRWMKLDGFGLVFFKIMDTVVEGMYIYINIFFLLGFAFKI